MPIHACGQGGDLGGQLLPQRRFGTRQQGLQGRRGQGVTRTRPAGLGNG